jgi:hypothetical protein
MKSWEHDAEKAMATWIARDAKYACAICTGTRNYPRNYANTCMGVGLRAADAQGTRILSSDANGLGPQKTEISSPRWSEHHDRHLPPCDWCASYNRNIAGQAMDTPADIAWDLIPEIECDPDSVALAHTEPALYNPQLVWLTNMGISEMLQRSSSVGDLAFATGLDHNVQLVEANMQACYLASQTWDYEFASRAMATVKVLQENHGCHTGWPQVDAAHREHAQPKHCTVSQF